MFDNRIKHRENLGKLYKELNSTSEYQSMLFWTRWNLYCDQFITGFQDSEVFDNPWLTYPFSSKSTKFASKKRVAVSILENAISPEPEEDVDLLVYDVLSENAKSVLILNSTGRTVLVERALRHLQANRKSYNVLQKHTKLGRLSSKQRVKGLNLKCHSQRKTHLWENFWQWVNPVLEGLFAHGQDLGSVSRELSTQEDVHQVNLENKEYWI